VIEAVVHRLKCDRCRAAWISPEGDTPDQARTQASLFGWVHVMEQGGGWFDQCPRCTHKAKATTS
jgi:hypothetical protein